MQMSTLITKLHCRKYSKCNGGDVGIEQAVAEFLDRGMHASKSTRLHVRAPEQYWPVVCQTKLLMRVVGGIQLLTFVLPCTAVTGTVCLSPFQR